MSDKLPGLLEQLPQLPELIREQTRGAELGGARKPDPQLQRIEEQLIKAERSRHKLLLIGCLTAAALLLSNPALLGSSARPEIAWALLASAGLVLVLRR